MEDRSYTRRQPYATRVWPPPGHRAGPEQEPSSPAADEPDALPPSGRMYGAPAAPPPRRLPAWAPRVLVAVAAVVTAAAVLTGLTRLVLANVHGAAPVPASVADTLAGVTLPLPQGWREGMVAPVTAFTSVVSHGDQAMVMSRAGGPVPAGKLAQMTLELAEQYSRLLLHGDRVIVVADRPVTVDGRAGHTRELRAEYRDVVNRPSYLRVTVLSAPGGGSTVLLGVAQPDTPGARADIDAIMAGAR